MPSDSLNENSQLFYVNTPEPEAAVPKFGIIMLRERKEASRKGDQDCSSSGLFFAYTHCVPYSATQHNQPAYPTDQYTVVVHSHAGLTNSNILNALTAGEQAALVFFWKELHPEEPLPRALMAIAPRSSKNDKKSTGNWYRLKSQPMPPQA